MAATVVRPSLASLFLALVTIQFVRGQVWTLDGTFAPDLINEKSAAESLSFVPAPDGSIFATGNFTHADRVATTGLARLKSDGTIDPAFSFAPAGLLGIAPLAGGQLLANRLEPSTISFYVVRLLADGRVDPTFAWTAASTRTLVTPLPGGGALVWENTTFTLSPAVTLTRYQADGTRDPGFNPALTGSQRYIDRVVPVANGSIYLSTIPGLIGAQFVRLRADGSVDEGFKPTALTYNPALLAAQPDGKLLFEALLPVTSPGATRPFAYTTTLRRLLLDGTLDPGFAPAFDGGPQAVAALPDGRIAVQAAPFDQSDGPAGMSSSTPMPPVARQISILGRATVLILSATGTVERDLRDLFGEANDVHLLGADADGRVLVRYGPPLAGRTGFINNMPVIPIPGTIPIRRPAQLDLARATHARVRPEQPAEQRLPVKFAQRASHGGRTHRLHADSAGRVIAAGPFTEINGQPRDGFARFMPDGTLDPTFQPAPRPDSEGGKLFLLLVQPDHKLIVRDSVLGPPDSNGTVSYAPRIYRLGADGREDSTFSPSPALALSAHWLTATGDGRLLVAIFEPNHTREENLKLIWLGSDGRPLATLPTAFGALYGNDGLRPMTSGFRVISSEPQSSAFGYVTPFSDVRQVAGGKLLVSGTFKRVNGTDCFGLVRLLPDGQLDTTYQADLAGFTWLPLISIQADGGAFVMGTDYRTGRGVTRLRRLLPNGSRDPGFPEQPGLTYWPPRLGADGQPERDDNLLFTRPDGTRMTTWYPVAAADGSRWVETSEQNGRLFWNSLARLVPREVVGITAQPQSQAVVVGRAVDLFVSVGTRLPATYQWFRDSSPLPGATSPVLSLPSVADRDAGAYHVRVTIGGQAISSSNARLTVMPNTARLMNLSARSLVTPQAPQNAGLVVAADSPRPVLMRAVGRGLFVGDYGSLLPVPVLTLYDGNRVIAEDRGGALAPGITALARSVGAFPLNTSVLRGPDVIYGSALTPTLERGAFTATTTSGDGGSGIALLEFYDSGTAATMPLMRNLSLRGVTAPGNGVLTAGFVIGGDGPLTVLIRGIGPTLSAFGISDPIADPSLVVHAWTVVLAAAGSWGQDPAIAAASRAVGAFALPLGSRDAATLLTLEPGAYTVQLSSTAGATGTGMIEIYALDK